jgi:hypothetical protein
MLSMAPIAVCLSVEVSAGRSAEGCMGRAHLISHMMSTSLGMMPAATSSARTLGSNARLCSRRSSAMVSTGLCTGMNLLSFCTTPHCTRATA